MTATTIFPSDMLNDRSCDEAFIAEKSLLRWSDIVSTSLVDHHALTSYGEAVFRALPSEQSNAVYRGWMMTAEAYELFYASLASKNINLVTNPENYRAAHYLNGWINIFDGLTPKSMILDKSATPADIKFAATFLDSESFIVKDFVKSRKHEWETACYAPNLDILPNIVAEFIRLQEDFLVGGVVIREFVNLDKRVPEVRVWWSHNVPVLATLHPDASDDDVMVEPPAHFLDEVKFAVQVLGAPFVTTDLAKTASGEWIVIEVGDGQVSGMPSSVSDEDYQKLIHSVVA